MNSTAIGIFKLSAFIFGALVFFCVLMSAKHYKESARYKPHPVKIVQSYQKNSYSRYRGPYKYYSADIMYQDKKIRVPISQQQYQDHTEYRLNIIDVPYHYLHPAMDGWLSVITSGVIVFAWMLVIAPLLYLVWIGFDSESSPSH